MGKLVIAAMAAALAGCVNIEDKGYSVIRERTVDITATGYERLKPGKYRFCVERSDLPLDQHAWSWGTLTVTEDRKYIYGDPAKEVE